jgi:hypothetical protein
MDSAKRVVEVNPDRLKTGKTIFKREKQSNMIRIYNPYVPNKDAEL